MASGAGSGLRAASSGAAASGAGLRFAQRESHGERAREHEERRRHSHRDLKWRCGSYVSNRGCETESKAASVGSWYLCSSDQDQHRIGPDRIIIASRQIG